METALLIGMFLLFTAGQWITFKICGETNHLGLLILLLRRSRWTKWLCCNVFGNDDWYYQELEKRIKVWKATNVELRGAEPAYRRSVPLERRVGGAGDQNPLFELHGPDGQKWALYEDGTATGFPDGTVIVNRAKPQFDLLRGREKQFKAALISDQQ